MMPGMNGHAFLRIIRNDQRRNAMPVIVLSALATGDLLKATIELGVQAWFIKANYTVSELLEAIDRLTQPYPPHHGAEAPSSSRWQNIRWLDN